MYLAFILDLENTISHVFVCVCVCLKFMKLREIHDATSHVPVRTTGNPLIQGTEFLQKIKMTWMTISKMPTMCTKFTNTVMNC